jgi:hypothetical protein
MLLVGGLVTLQSRMLGLRLALSSIMITTFATLGIITHAGRDFRSREGVKLPLLWLLAAMSLIWAVLVPFSNATGAEQQGGEAQAQELKEEKKDGHDKTE